MLHNKISSLFLSSSLNLRHWKSRMKSQNQRLNKLMQKQKMNNLKLWNKVLHQDKLQLKNLKLKIKLYQPKEV